MAIDHRGFYRTEKKTWNYTEQCTKVIVQLFSLTFVYKVIVLVIKFKSGEVPSTLLLSDIVKYKLL